MAYPDTDDRRPEAYPIGELARLTGTPVKTIRYYSDVGVLPPTARTASGYRLYSDVDRARLELVRTLRESGVDLATVRTVVERQVSLRDAMRIQLEAVEAQLRSHQRVRAVLRAALDRGSKRGDEPADDHEHLRRLHAMADFGAAEITELLDDFVDDVGGEAPARTRWLACLRDAMLPELPEEPTIEQLDAWLELVELLSDPDFRASLRGMGAGFWETAEEYDVERFHTANQRVIQAATEAIEQGVAPADPEATEALDVFVTAQAELRERPADAAFEAALLRSLDDHDPRAERHWELVATINGWPWPPPETRAYTWIAAALRHRVSDRVSGWAGD